MNTEELKNTINDILIKVDKNKVCDEIVLVGATKTRDINTIESAFKAGLFVAGENKVQELLAKYIPIEGLSWHFIGALQTNKVKYIVDKVDMIHSVDRVELAKEIDNRCRKINKMMPILVEVNVGGEISKSGIVPEKLFDFLNQLKNFPFLVVSGIMTVLPIGASEDLYKRTNELFLSAKKSFPDLPLKWLSMGMSNDYEIALRNGANMIRLGTAIFGERRYF